MKSVCVVLGRRTNGGAGFRQGFFCRPISQYPIRPYWHPSPVAGSGSIKSEARRDRSRREVLVGWVDAPRSDGSLVGRQFVEWFEADLHTGRHWRGGSARPGFGRRIKTAQRAASKHIGLQSG